MLGPFSFRGFPGCLLMSYDWHQNRYSPQNFFKVARLQSEFCTDYFLSYEFSYEKCCEIIPEAFDPLFW